MKARPTPTAGSKILAAVHEAARDLHGAGFIDMLSMKQYDALCLAAPAAHRPFQRRPNNRGKPRASGG